MPTVHGNIRMFCAITLVTVMAGGLPGCSGYDVELDAPILNAVGINLGKSKTKVKTKARPTLVVPPSPKLPVPGSVAKAPANIDWPDDPDLRAKKMAELKKQKEIEDGTQRGPWHKAINAALGNGTSQEKDQDASAAEQQIQGENAAPVINSDSAQNSGWNSNVDLEKTN